MKVDFAKLRNQLKYLTFDDLDDEYGLGFNAIKGAVCFIVCATMTSEKLSKEQVDQHFMNALDLSQDFDLSGLSRIQKSIYNMIRDQKSMKHVLCYKDIHPDLTEEKQEAFRNCVRELYPRMTEAAQATKERLEMAEQPRLEAREEKQEESRKQVRWADRFPSKDPSNSNGITVGSK